MSNSLKKYFTGMKLNVEIDTPEIIIPENAATSENYVVAQLGGLRVSNSFKTVGCCFRSSAIIWCWWCWCCRHVVFVFCKQILINFKTLD